MAGFDFLSGSYPTQNYPSITPGQQGMPSPHGVPAYQAPWQLQAMNYPSITPGQQGAVTQGLDWGKLGQWALNQPATQSGGYQQALAALGGITQPANQAPTYHQPLQAGRAGGPLGTVNQQPAGYIGSGMTPQVLQSNFLRAR
jgi:hypothetical protein